MLAAGEPSGDFCWWIASVLLWVIDLFSHSLGVPEHRVFRSQSCRTHRNSCAFGVCRTYRQCRGWCLGEQSIHSCRLALCSSRLDQSCVGLCGPGHRRLKMLTIPHTCVGVFSPSFIARRSQLYRPTCEHLDVGQETGLNALVSRRAPRGHSTRSLCSIVEQQRRRLILPP